jgi:hypothetical protein
MARSKKNKSAAAKRNSIKKNDSQNPVPSLLSLSANVIRKNWNSDFSDALGDYRKVVWNDWKAANRRAVEGVPVEHLDLLGTLVCGAAENDTINISRATHFTRKLVHNLCRELRLVHISSSSESERTISVSVPENWNWEFGPMSAEDQERENVQRERKMMKRKQKTTYRKRENLKNLEFQFNCKFRAYGYDCAEDMKEGEKDMYEGLKTLRAEFGR